MRNIGVYSSLSKSVEKAIREAGGYISQFYDHLDQCFYGPFWIHLPQETIRCEKHCAYHLPTGKTIYLHAHRNEGYWDYSLQEVPQYPERDQSYATWLKKRR